MVAHRWNVEEVLELAERENVTTIGAVPTSILQFLASPSLARRRLDSLSAVTTGAAPVPSRLIETAARLLGSRVSVSTGYGLTETTASAAVNSGRDLHDRPGSAGQPLPSVDLRIVAASGEGVERNSVGEITIAGSTVMKGYWNDPDATNRVLVDGWFRTGDLGYLDDDGYLHVVDRLKDVVVRGGENVYSAEVEGAISDHPDVIDVAVVGLPDATWGEVVAAVVNRRSAAVTAESLTEFCRERLAHFKVPSTFVFDVDIPRNPTGKILKGELRTWVMSRASGTAAT